ncbi:MAG TPA: SWIB/MDM2 domain-containing protein [Gemmatimonadaceae bacterium]|nr:SWIB/MDM2 domain-containing protein [Gemmatimonadaceae bacterium]
MAARKKGGAKKGGARKGGAKKGARKGGAKRGGAKKSSSRKSAGKKRSGAKRTPNAAFMKAMQPSEQLSAVVGSSPMPRTEITKKLWQYIKRKGLQDAKERRMINADENLRPIFKKDQVSMFDMTKLVNKHLS